MKNWIVATFIVLSTLLTCSAQILEHWTYDGVSDGPLSSAPSLSGTGNSFGSGASFLQVKSLAGLISPPSFDYLQGISDASYQGKTTGIVTISYDVDSVFFLNTTGSATFGFGLRSLASGTDDCNVFLLYQAKEYKFVVTDANGTQTSASISSGQFNLTDLSVKQVYNLDVKGTPGSFKVYYSIAGGADVEIFPETLTVHADFNLNEFTFAVPFTGTSWRPSNNSFSFDNLLLEAPSPVLEFVQQGVSYIQDNGILGGDTYEPGDILQIVTTNKNDSVVTATDVSTSLSANPSSFSITPLSTLNFSSVDPGEIYTATYRVEILDGAVNGSNTFTVVNQIGAGADAVAFPASF